VARRDIHNSDIPKVCQSCEARHRGICGALSANELTELNKHTKRLRVPAGTELLAEQQPIAAYANVISGVIKLSKLLEDGRQQIVGLQFPPDLLGRPFRELSNVTAEAAVDAELCMFSRTALEQAVNGSQAMSARLHEQSLRELDEAREWMLTLGRKTAYEKVASFLALIVTAVDVGKAEIEEEPSIPLPLSRGEMADFLGLTIETVSRQMSALRKNDIIEFDNAHTVRVKDRDALNASSGT
jgi:CRP/FNR family transcriptional regulator